MSTQAIEQAQAVRNVVEQETPRGVLLALAVLFLWVAGVLYFIAFEGSAILTGRPTGADVLQQIGQFFRSVLTGKQITLTSPAAGGYEIEPGADSGGVAGPITAGLYPFGKPGGGIKAAKP